MTAPAGMIRDLLLSLRIDCGGRAIPAREVLDPWQRADLEAVLPGLMKAVGIPDGGEGKSRVWQEKPRGHSKTSDAALLSVVALACASRAVRGVVAAADAEQAGLLVEAVRTLTRLNPALDHSKTVTTPTGAKSRGLLKVEEARVTNVRTGSTLEVISSDVASSYGVLCDWILIEELCHWPREALWTSLFSAAAKKENCLLIVLTNSGWQDSWQWALREKIKADPDWHFSRLDGPVASWVTPKRLAEQERLLPRPAFERLWLNRWSSGSGDAIDPADLAAALCLAGPTAGPEVGWLYAGGLDLGLKRDAAALCIVGRHVGFVEQAERPEPAPADPTFAALADLGMFDESAPTDREDDGPADVVHPGTGRLKLAHVQTWKPSPGRPVDLAEVEAAVRSAFSRWGLGLLAADAWQSAQMVQRLTADGLPAECVDPVPGRLSEQALEVTGAFRDRRIDLFNDPDLLADLKRLRVAEKQYGFRLVSPTVSGTGAAAPGVKSPTQGPGTRHQDAASAFALSLWAARKVENAAPARLTGPLCY